MHNHKGAIATLLTLGLVVIGTLITLGTSLFVNNKNTNIASNPRASSQASCNGIVSGCNQNYYACGSNKYSSTSSCSNNDVGDEGPGNYCKRVCVGSGTDNACKSAGGNCDDNCNNGNYGLTANRYCKENERQDYCCKASSSSGGGGGGAYNNGNIVGENQSCCFRKNNKIYVYATYQSMVNNGMLDDNGNVDCARQSGAVQRSYQADNLGAFVCPGDTTNLMSVDDYERANPTEAPTEVPAKKCGQHNQGDNFCETKSSGFQYLMWCNNGSEETVTKCPNGCKDIKKGIAMCSSVTPSPTPIPSLSPGVGSGASIAPTTLTPIPTSSPEPTPTIEPVACNPFSCYSGSDLKYIIKCANPGESACGGQYSIYAGSDCDNLGSSLYHGSQSDVESYAKNTFCDTHTRNVSVNINVKIGENPPINYEPSKPQANFQICWYKGHLSEMGNSIDTFCPISDLIDLSKKNIDINIQKSIAVEGELHCFLSYNPAGLSWYNTISCQNFSENNGQIVGDIGINL